MFDLGPLAPPASTVVVAGIMAIVAGLMSFRKYHNYMILPIIYAIGWITLGYIGYWIGGLDTGDLGFFVRSGLIVIFLSIVVGGAILIYEKRQ